MCCTQERPNELYFCCKTLKKCERFEDFTANKITNIVWGISSVNFELETKVSRISSITVTRFDVCE
jgi:hypothetical protein